MRVASWLGAVGDCGALRKLRRAETPVEPLVTGSKDDDRSRERSINATLRETGIL
jgi:hypothetical protein